jgi:hypothetical protein
MKIIKYFLLIVLVALISGCAHKIDISPSNDKVTANSSEINQKDYSVGYYFDNINLEVISAGGGGDKVKYEPYKETESAFRAVLVKHFTKVYNIKSLTNKKFILDNNIKYIFTYKMNTYSFSESVFTWPPTKFSITLECKAVDREDNLIWNKVIMDDGYATYDEFKYDFSLAAKRASENVFKKLMIELNNVKEMENK